MPVAKVCVECGTDFKVKPRDAKQLCCTQACQRVYESKHGRPSAQKELMHFTCATCGDGFSYKPSIITAYRKKHGKDPLYCSRPCSYAGMHKKTADRSTFVCLHCGKVNAMKRYQGEGRTVYYRAQKYCDNACKSEHQKTLSLERFQAGEIRKHKKTRGGYVHVYIPSLVTGKKHSIPEHRFVMSRHLGRDLFDGETVHHINGDRTDNRLENLKLFASNHGPGQEVEDIISWCAEMMNRYPDFTRAAGYQLVKLE